MLPGLIDCHTHLVYGGNRVEEYENAPVRSLLRGDLAGGGRHPIHGECHAGAGGDSLLASAMLRAERLDVRGRHHHRDQVRLWSGARCRATRFGSWRENWPRLPLSVRTTYLGIACVASEYRERRAEFVAAASGAWLEHWLPRVGGCGGCLLRKHRLHRGGDRTAVARGAALWAAGAHACRAVDRYGGGRIGSSLWRAVGGSFGISERGGCRGARGAGTVAVLLPGAYYMLRQTVPPPVALAARGWCRHGRCHRLESRHVALHVDCC
jgi:imidazolonepropionase